MIRSFIVISMTALVVLFACARLQVPPDGRSGTEVLACSHLRRIIPQLSERLVDAKFAAVTIGHYRVYLTETPSDALRCHEAKHVEQQARDGAAYYERYFAEFISKGYRENSYEREAREACGQ